MATVASCSRRPISIQRLSWSVPLVGGRHRGGPLHREKPEPALRRAQPLDQYVRATSLRAAAAAHRRRRRQLGHSHARRVDRGDGVPRRRDVSPRGEPRALPGAGCAILLFALGHINPLALGKETLLLFALQVFTGTSFTLLAFATGGLAAPIVAHCLYDWYTFYESHLAVKRGKIVAHCLYDWYTFYESSRGRRGRARRCPETRVPLHRHEPRDGKISPDELRIALFSFGIKTDDATAKATFAAADTDSSGDVSFDEFARFVKNGDGDASKAFKRGLVGVA